VLVHPGFEFYAVWERSKNIAAEKYAGVKTFRSLDEMLADEKVELVVVNTPNITHYAYAKKALQAGKHVIVEKPFTVTTVTTSEAGELIALAQQVNRKLSVYHNRRYDSDYRTIKRVLAEGWLGEVVEAEFHFDRYRAELSPKTHKEVAGAGTGALYDLGAHLIDQALQLFGMPDAIYADILVLRPHSQVDDYFELLFYYPQKRVRLKCSYLVREPLPGYILHGRNGSFIKAKTDVQETTLQAGVMPGSTGWGREPDSEKGLLHAEKEGRPFREQVVSECGNYMDYYQGIYDAVRHNKAVPVAAEDARDVIRIIEAAFESSRAQQVVKLFCPEVQAP
jgi:scyllo-inositol 2-dehydrogenase (NADP+)